MNEPTKHKIFIPYDPQAEQFLEIGGVRRNLGSLLPTAGRRQLLTPAGDLIEFSSIGATIYISRPLEACDSTQPGVTRLLHNNQPVSVTVEPSGVLKITQFLSESVSKQVSEKNWKALSEPGWYFLGDSLGDLDD